MEYDKYEERKLRLYWKRKLKAALAARKTYEIENTTNERWCNLFNRGNVTHEDRLRSHPPTVYDLQVKKEAVKKI